MTPAAMTRAVVLQHAAFEGPAMLARLLVQRGVSLDTRRLDQGDALPESLSANEMLVVMGGPMGIGDLERPECSFLRDELRLLRWCVEHDAPVLGICLGAQLLAFAAGAPVHPMTFEDGTRCHEVGWGDVDFHALNGSEPTLRGLPSAGIVLHWHGDVFELPRHAVLLASSPLCRNQAFKLGSRMFGLQFHCEVGEEHVEAFLRADAAFVASARGQDGADQIRRDTIRYANASAALGERLLGNILDAMGCPDGGVR